MKLPIASKYWMFEALKTISSIIQKVKMKTDE